MNTNDNMNTNTNNTALLVTKKQLMAMLNIGHGWLDNFVRDGMPRVCLNPDGDKYEVKIYRYNPQAVLAWLDMRQNKHNTQQ